MKTLFNKLSNPLILLGIGGVSFFTGLIDLLLTDGSSFADLRIVGVIALYIFYVVLFGLFFMFLLLPLINMVRKKLKNK